MVSSEQIHSLVPASDQLTRLVRSFRFTFLFWIASNLLIACPSIAQTGQSLQPTASRHNVESLIMVAQVSIPSVDREFLLQEDKLRQEQGLPSRFAIKIPALITQGTHGTWQSLDPETDLWRLRITCPGALSVNLGFTKFRLPPDASLFIYDAHNPHNGTRGYTALDNETHGQLWTPIVLSDDIVVELTVSPKELHLVELELTAINIGYRSFGDQLGLKSQECHIDVACPEADDWSDEIQAVGVFTINGQFNCTGFMVNNTAEDQTPYFMTANHCGIDSADAATLVVYWNFQSPSCGDHGGGSLDQNQSGSIWRAANPITDFTLVELDDAPDPAWRVAFAGWDRSPEPPTSGAMIHQPGCDEKSISLEYDPMTITGPVGDDPGDGTRIRVADWDLGSIEPGSSGAPLFNQNHRVVGQATEALANCYNDMPTWFGFFAVSWNLGGSESEHLSGWLDPLGTDVMALDSLVPFASGLRTRPSGDLVATGMPGGPFTPAEMAYIIDNRGDFEISYQVFADRPWVSVTNAMGSLPPDGSTVVTISINETAANLEVGLHYGTVFFENLTDHDGDTSRKVRLRIGDPAPVYTISLDSDPGWTREGAWEFGQPLGGGGDFGGPDPTSGYSGLNVFGYNLAGDYDNDIPEHHLTSSAIDCSQLSAVSLRFWRWLGVEGGNFDHAKVAVSNNGIDFHTIWHNTTAVTDYAWSLQEFDISQVADGQETLYLRWTMGPTDSGWCYCGWNIDDIEIWGLDISAQPVFLTEFIVIPARESIDIHWSLGVECEQSEFRLLRHAGSGITAIPYQRQSECGYRATDRLADRFLGQEVVYELLWKDEFDVWIKLASKTVLFESVPARSRLIGIYPNPCNPQTTVSFTLNRTQDVFLSVYDLTGRLVAILADWMYLVGTHTVEWDGKNAFGRTVSSGTYVVRMETEGHVESQKIMLVR